MVIRTRSYRMNCSNKRRMFDVTQTFRLKFNCRSHSMVSLKNFNFFARTKRFERNVELNCLTCLIRIIRTTLFQVKSRFTITFRAEATPRIRKWATLVSTHTMWMRYRNMRKRSSHSYESKIPLRRKCSLNVCLL